MRVSNLTNTFDRNGSFGLTTAITNVAGVQTVATSASGSIVEPPPQPPFPVIPPLGPAFPQHNHVRRLCVRNTAIVLPSRDQWNQLIRPEVNFVIW